MCPTIGGWETIKGTQVRLLLQVSKQLDMDKTIFYSTVQHRPQNIHFFPETYEKTKL